MKIIFALATLLLCSPAFAEDYYKFKDGTYFCGTYYEKGNSYCRNVGGGEMCFAKSEVKSIRKGVDCETIQATEKNTTLEQSSFAKEKQSYIPPTDSSSSGKSASEPQNNYSTKWMDDYVARRGDRRY